jgi:hypothetical protein
LSWRRSDIGFWSLRGFPYLLVYDAEAEPNNGRANHVWQSIYLDQYNDFVMDRWPLPFLELHPDDMKELGLNTGDLVEVYNDNGSTQAMAQPRPTEGVQVLWHFRRLLPRPARFEASVVNLLPPGIRIGLGDQHRGQAPGKMPAVFIVAISLQRPASWGSAARVLTGAAQPASTASTGRTRRMEAFVI